MLRRRTPLKAKTPLKPTEFKRKPYAWKRKKRMPAVNTKRQRDKQQRAELLYCDSFGVPFAEANKWFTVPANQWALQYPIRVVKRPEIIKAWKERAGESHFDVETRDRLCWGTCWLCGDQASLDPHHVVPRYDLAGNICMCCRPCHERVQDAPEALPEVLRALWQNNPFVSWVHLVRLRGKTFTFDSLGDA